MAFIGGAILGGAIIGGLSSRSASKRQASAMNRQNEANERIAAEANRQEKEMYYQSRGAAMGATLDEMTARPFNEDGSENPDYDPNLSMFEPDGSPKNSAILPLYLSGLEKDQAEAIEQGFDTLGQYYDKEKMIQEIQGYQEQLAPARQNALDTLSALYDGSQLEETNQYLDEIQGARLEGAGAQAQAMINEAQRNAARQNYTGKTGVVGNSGNALAQNLQALAQGYGAAGQNMARAKERGATERFAAYEQDLDKKMNFNQLPSALNALAQSQTAGIDSVFAAENATSNALARGGYQIGVGRAPEYNAPVYTAPVKKGGWEVAGDAISGGLSGLMLAKGLGAGGGFNRPTSIGPDVTGAGTSYYIPGTDQYTI